MKILSYLLVTVLLASTAAAGGNEGANDDAREVVLNLPMRSAGPGSLDPVLGSTTYDNRAANKVYETLLQYKYLKRPYELEPLLLAEMPARIDDRTWRFTLKEGVVFQDDACFPGGKGRALVTDDVFYSWRRLADPAFEYKSWWILKDAHVEGLNEYKEEQGQRVSEGNAFDYSAPVSGFRKIDDRTFEIRLDQPVYRFMWTLAMFQLSVVPHEAVEMYGSKFSRHPVGTGPFVLTEWITNKSMSFVKNPTYHPCFYPDEWMPEDEEFGLHEFAGQRLPFADRVEITFFVQENPMWLEFKSGKLDYIQVPEENQLEVFHKRSRRIKSEMRDKGITLHAVPLLDFIFRAFNMEDELLGGYTEKKRKLRQAIALATDLYEFNTTFYGGVNILYDGMVPPGMDGYPKDGKGPISWLNHDLQRARELLAEAGYPGGEGLPVIEYYSSTSGNIPEQTELFKRQLTKIGIELNVHLLNFAQLIETVDNKKAPLFTFAWSSDYPDAENNLALFYGPNESPGSNHFNYKNAEYDKLYEKLLPMDPSPERTKLIETMRDIVMADTAFIGSMARTRFYVINPWLTGYKPEETFTNWVKYMGLDESKRQL